MTTKPPRRALAAALLALPAAVVAAVLLWPDRGAPGGAPPPPPERPFAALPKIDVHVHTGPSTWRQLLGIMDDQGISVALNASGGSPGQGLEEAAAIAARTGGRIRFYCNVSVAGVEDPAWVGRALEALRRCREAGAVGWKIFKGLGLGITLADGSLLRVSDPRLDPLFEEAGALGLPVLLHTGDPQAFFRPPTPDNERYAELRAHPGWSFWGERPDGQGRWPSWEELFAQYEARVGRHPGTTFIGAHFGNAPEEPERVGRMLDDHHNLLVETGARVPEIGRHPPDAMRRLFVRHQDRILFGTDLQLFEGGMALGSAGAEPDGPAQVPGFFAAHWRYFETGGRRMAHPTPIQGDWTIDGVDLPRPVLEKLYWRNAVRVFGLPEPPPPARQ